MLLLLPPELLDLEGDMFLWLWACWRMWAACRCNWRCSCQGFFSSPFCVPYNSVATESDSATIVDSATMITISGARRYDQQVHHGDNNNEQLETEPYLGLASNFNNCVTYSDSSITALDTMNACV
eukprot:scaffold84076_cov58-Attheya_sp.AAC.5